MPDCNPILFKRSLIALAIVSLSACSTTPRVEDYDLSRIGEGILSAGRTTADVSQRAWDKTNYLLGFSDVEPNRDNELLMDEVDFALMEEDAVLPGQEATVRPVVIQTATAIPLDQAPVSQDQTVLEIASTQLPVDNVMAVEDLVHEVASNETLWDISKKTTGDANNWHVLADVNNLAPNANVFPGQQLIIPADMVKPGYDDAEELPQIQTAAIAVDTQNLLGNVEDDETLLVTEANTVASNERLAVPVKDAQAIEIAEAKIPEGKAFELNAGETLWDFAKRTTGDATNWKAIAGQNNFTEKQAVVVRAGQTIYVPDALVKPELDVVTTDVAASSIDTPAKLTVQDAEVAVAQPTTPTDSDAISATTELLAEASALDETQPIKIVEATFKADDTITAITLSQATASAAAATAAPVVADSASNPVQIMVSGTYYPKAVYNDADFSSSLLMRVSPGTTLQVSKAMGNWFEVETDKGLGYVHQRDIK